MDPKEALKVYVTSLLGLPYVWGGDDPVFGFDCSGMVLEILKSQNLWGKTDATAQDLFMFFLKQGPQCFAQSPEFGSLVFFGKDAQSIVHVGFAINQYQMIEAGGGGSKTTSKEDAAKQNAYVRIRPISRRGDLKGIFNPLYVWRQK